MSKTYSEGGKARKVCPECGLYCHARSLDCPNCGHKFREPKNPPKEKVEKVAKEPLAKKEPTVYNEAGKGRKKCPTCDIYVAARLVDCPQCGNKIPKQPKAEKVIKNGVPVTVKPTLPEDTNKKYVGRLVFTPAGEPPIKPDENVESWCTAVFADGLKNGITYSNQALWHWYQYFCNNEQSTRDRIWEWSKREGFDKMQEHSEESVSSSEETEADTLQLSNQEE